MLLKNSARRGAKFLVLSNEGPLLRRQMRQQASRVSACRARREEGGVAEERRENPEGEGRPSADPSETFRDSSAVCASLRHRARKSFV